jgi:type I restriction enzyme S subunit
VKWTEKAIGTFCDTGSGGTPTRDRAAEFYGGSIPWVKSGELRESIILNASETITEAGLTNSSAKLVPAGALLVAMYGATVGRVGILGIEAATNQAVCHIIPKNGEADTRYLFHALQSKLPEFLSRSVGGAQPNISQEIIRRTSISLPPLKEQRRIAAILDKADTLRQKRRAALQKLDSLTQSIFLDMFGDPTSNPKGWAILPLGEIVDEFRYGTSNKSEGVGKPALRIPNVIGGTLDLIELKTVPVDDAEFRRLRLEDGDLLFVRTNGNQDNVGRCAVFDRKLVEGTGYSPDDFIFASYLIRARFARTKYDPIFLREFLLSSEGRRQLKRLSKTSAGQFNVNTESLGAIRVIQPPILSQQVFRRSVDTVGKLRTRYSTGLEVMNLQFESLQHRAFQGEL